MDRTCSSPGREDEAQNLTERENLEHLGIAWKIILKKDLQGKSVGL